MFGRRHNTEIPKKREGNNREREDRRQRSRSDGRLIKGTKFRRVRFVPALTIDLSSGELISAIKKPSIIIPTKSPTAEGAAKVLSFTTPRSLSHATTYTFVVELPRVDRT